MVEGEVEMIELFLLQGRKELLWHRGVFSPRYLWAALRLCGGIALFLCVFSVYAQNLPELPKIPFDNFGPGIREQVRKADEEG